MIAPMPTRSRTPVSASQRRRSRPEWLLAVHGAAALRHDFIGTEIRILFQAMERSFAKRSGIPLAPAHGTLLLIIEERPNLTQQQLSEAIGLQRSTVTRTIHVIERLGLVRRHCRANDRRSYAIRLTAKGARLARRLRPIIFGLEVELVKGFGARDRAVFVKLLRRAQDNMWSAAHRPPRRARKRRSTLDG